MGKPFIKFEKRGRWKRDCKTKVFSPLNENEPRHENFFREAGTICPGYDTSEADYQLSKNPIQKRVIHCYG